MALHALPFAIDAEPGQARQAAGRRVLLVGLDASSRKDASRWLASAGFEVAAADDAASALPLLEGSRPDVVFADASLRAEGLRAVGQALRSEDGRAVPIVALCASRRDVGRVLDAGIADLVERPFDWRVVSLRVQSLLRLAEAECELRLAKRETDALRRTLDDEQREKEYRDTRDSLDRPPERRSPRASAGERSRGRFRDEPGRARDLRSRATRPDQQPAGPCARELRPPAGRPAPERRPALRGSAARLGGPVDVDGGPRRRRALRGHAHRAAGLAGGEDHGLPARATGCPAATSRATRRSSSPRARESPSLPPTGSRRRPCSRRPSSRPARRWRAAEASASTGSRSASASAAAPSSACCPRPWPRARSGSTTSRSSRDPAAASAARRRCCAGSPPSSATCPRRSSSRSPRRRG